MEQMVRKYNSRALVKAALWMRLQLQQRYDVGARLLITGPKQRGDLRVRRRNTLRCRAGSFVHSMRHQTDGGGTVATGHFLPTPLGAESVRTAPWCRPDALAAPPSGAASTSNFECATAVSASGATREVTWPTGDTGTFLCIHGYIITATTGRPQNGSSAATQLLGRAYNYSTNRAIARPG